MKLPSPLLASHIKLSLADPPTATLVLPTPSEASAPSGLLSAASIDEDFAIPAAIAVSYANDSTLIYKNVDPAPATIYANDGYAPPSTATTLETYGATDDLADELESPFVPAPSSSNTVSPHSLSRANTLWLECCIPSHDMDLHMPLYRGTFVRNIAVVLQKPNWCSVCNSFNNVVLFTSHSISSPFSCIL